MKKLIKKLTKFISVLSFVAFIPLVASAASTCTATGLGGVLCTVSDLLGTAIPILVSLGVIYFIWGVVQYVIADSEEAKQTGKERMIYGIIGFAAIIGMWGLVNILVDTFGLRGTLAPTLAPIATGAGTACTLAGNPKFQDLLCYITGIINNSVIPLVFAIATVAFIWGVIQFFIIGADEQEKRAQGRQFMIWGIVALTVMISVWGLVNILGSTFGISGSILPQVKPPGASSSNTAPDEGHCPDGSIMIGSTCP